MDTMTTLIGAHPKYPETSPGGAPVATFSRGSIIAYEDGAKYTYDADNDSWTFHPIENAPLAGGARHVSEQVKPADGIPTAVEVTEWIKNPARSDDDLHGAVAAAINYTMQVMGPGLVEEIAKAVTETLKTGKVPMR